MKPDIYVRVESATQLPHRISASAWRDNFRAGVTFTIAKGERWGVLGRNGSGKTTLFNLLAGIAD